jgi:hypothetical protein
MVREIERFPPKFESGPLVDGELLVQAGAATGKLE